MAMIAHGGKPDRAKGPSMAVAKEFNAADAKTGILRKKRKTKAQTGGNAANATN